jgi:hypothetical protein
VQDTTEVRKRGEIIAVVDWSRGVVLLKVIEYLAYKTQYADFNTEDITEDFTDRIDPYIALEL